MKKRRVWRCVRVCGVAVRSGDNRRVERTGADEVLCDMGGS